jgi:uncharacterized protein (TIGR03086 family)
MNSTATQYEAAHRPLTAVLDAVPAESWTNPSPCEGWSARDVLRHMIETQREFLTGHGIDMGLAPDIDTDPAAAWRDHAKRVAEAISDDAVPAIRYDGHFGPTTVGATLEQFYIWDMLVHRWDIARSVGADDGLSDAELDRIDPGADSFGDALYMDGVCKPGVEAPPDADRKVRLLARLGRRA